MVRHRQEVFFAVNNVYAVLYKLYEHCWFFRSTASAGMGLRLTLHRDRNRSAVELNPRNLDRIHDPARHVYENRRSHADLERSRSDNASLLKSRVTHRVSLAPGRGRRGD